MHHVSYPTMHHFGTKMCTYAQQIYRDASFCNRNVHMRAHFCYEMVHCGVLVWCIAGFVTWLNPFSQINAHVSRDKVLLQCRTSQQNSSLIQIKRNFERLSVSSFQLSIHVEILRRAREYDIRPLCKVSKRSDNWEISHRQTSFPESLVKISLGWILYIAKIAMSPSY